VQVQLRTIRHGEGHPVRFVLVHGLASAARMWDGVGAALAARGHGSVAVDLRGHGESPKPDDGFDFPTVVGDLVPILEALDEPPVVAGQSYGGNVVVELAAARPDLVRAIACVDGGAIDLTQRFSTLDEARTAMRPPYEQFEGITVAQEEAHLRRAHPDWPESGIQGALAVNEHLPDGTIRSRLGWSRHRQIIDAMWSSPPSRLWSSMTVPVLFLIASARMRGGVEKALAELADARAVYLEGAEHDVHAQQPELVADHLVGLL
jgi:pimeloyl-ACP methyl ester carboxylesterase